MIEPANPHLFADTMVDMSWPAIQASADNHAIVLLPVGMIEAHGPHLDLSADIVLAHAYCRLLRQTLVSLAIPALIAPPFYWGHAADTARYAGTFSVRPETMQALLVDILSSLDSWGFRHVFLSNWHGDRTHIRMIDAALAEANDKLALRAYALGALLEVPVRNPPDFPPERPGKFKPDYHAGALETAQMHLLFPHRVDAALARTLPPSNSFHPNAYCGDPASFELEDRLQEHFRAKRELDARKIEALLAAANR